MYYINIYFDADNLDLGQSKLQSSKYWKFIQRKIFTNVTITYLKLYEGEGTFYYTVKKALKELIEIIEFENLDLGRINFNYFYLYKDQCNIEFDEEYIQLFSKLNCYITIECAEV